MTILTDDWAVKHADSYCGVYDSNGKLGFDSHDTSASNRTECIYPILKYVDIRICEGNLTFRVPHCIDSSDNYNKLISSYPEPSRTKSKLHPTFKSNRITPHASRWILNPLSLVRRTPLVADLLFVSIPHASIWSVFIWIDDREWYKSLSVYLERFSRQGYPAVW